MKAGRALDALVAEHVMGWTEVNSKAQWNYVESRSTGWPDCLVGMRPNDHADNVMHKNWQRVPDYSTDLRAAWLVKECVPVDHLHWSIFEEEVGYILGMTGQNAAHAICLAALKALGVNVE